MYVNQRTFRQWWDVFHSDNQLTEIRLLGRGANGRSKTSSGYFKDCEDAWRALMDYPDEMGVYSPMNQIRDSCFGRDQSNRFVDNAKNTTSGADIEGRRWIMLDFDPKRASDTNSTDKEKRRAWDLMMRVGTFLRDNGFAAPVIADSCNG